MEQKNWWNQIKQWMSPPKAKHLGCRGVPMQHKPISRDEEELRAYQEWKASDGLHKALGYISDNYHTWQEAPCEQCQHIDFLCLPSSRGFVLHLMDTDQACDEATHLFDFLKERVMELGYRSYMSDMRLFQRRCWIERNERHYLKPALSLSQDGRQEQRFGNICIEIRFRDDSPLHLKFSASTYQDRQFAAAEDFGDLMRYVLR